MEKKHHKRKLKIAQIAPVIEPVPPKKYGGTERIVYTLTEELVKRGHEVTLFATGNSQTSAKLISVYPRGLREAKIPNIYGLNELTLLNIATAFAKQEDFDIIHDHNTPTSLPTAYLSKTPTIVTIHGPITSKNRSLYQIVSQNVHLVPISKAQKAPTPDLKTEHVIHHGLDFKNYPFGEKSQGYLLFVGRFSLEKGLHFAIEAAQYLDIPLVIAAKLDYIDLEYFKQYIEPKLSDDLIRWVGEVTEEERNNLMSGAICLLQPENWREPFGLTMIEAMACGCPVVAFRKGSVPEIVTNAKTGFVVEDTEGMIQAIENIGMISRAETRKVAFSKFSAKKMADKYEDLYYKLVRR